MLAPVWPRALHHFLKMMHSAAGKWTMAMPVGEIVDAVRTNATENGVVGCGARSLASLVRDEQFVGKKTCLQNNDCLSGRLGARWWSRAGRLGSAIADI